MDPNAPSTSKQNINSTGDSIHKEVPHKLVDPATTSLETLEEILDGMKIYFEAQDMDKKVSTDIIADSPEEPNILENTQMNHVAKHEYKTALMLLGSLKKFEPSIDDSAEIKAESSELKTLLCSSVNIVNWNLRLNHEAVELKKAEEDLHEVTNNKSTNNISKSKLSVNSDSETIEENFIMVSGSELNVIWWRLTGLQMLQYDCSKTYKMRETEIEDLYNKAKQFVLFDFPNNTQIFNKMTTENGEEKEKKSEIGESNA